jgi:hypothetical protein
MREDSQSKGSSDAARINSQPNRGLPNQRAVQALTAAVIATTAINSSASLALRLKGFRSGAAQGTQVEPFQAAI